jgi:hypothetical protein
MLRATNPLAPFVFAGMHARTQTPLNGLTWGALPLKAQKHCRLLQQQRINLFPITVDWIILTPGKSALRCISMEMES